MAENTGLLVPCSKCGFFVHGRCVSIPRITPKMKYVCPFCSDKKIRCVCENNDKFDEPLVQCTKCHFWIHKACAGFVFGRVPEDFSCWNCGIERYRLPRSRFITGICRDARVALGVDRAAVLAKLPEGEFRDKVDEDLGKSELDFRETMCSYIDEFAPCLFDFTKEFWKVFVGTLADMLACEKNCVMEAMDELITSMLYQDAIVKSKLVIPGLVVSEAIAPDLENEKLLKMESLPTPTELRLTEDMRVIVETEVENGQFICEVPGLLCHEDEIDANEGIPRHVIGVPDMRVVVDTSRSSNQLLRHIRRSFNFNCDVKLIRLGKDVKVGLFGTRLRGLLSDDKLPRNVSILEHGELLLPIDAALPFPVDKPFWKIKKAKPVVKPKKVKVKIEKKPEVEIKPKKKKVVTQVVDNRAMKTRARTEFPFSLTLLSSFCEDACPPMPIVIKNQKEMDEENPDPDSIRGRVRQRHNRHIINEESE